MLRTILGDLIAGYAQHYISMRSILVEQCCPLVSVLHAFSLKGGPRPPLGFAKGGPKFFKGGPNFFSPTAAVAVCRGHRPPQQGGENGFFKSNIGITLKSI